MAKDLAKLSSIVIDMLAQNISDDKIITYLVQSGVDESSAKSVLEKAKKEFDKTLSERLEAVIDRKMTEMTAQKLQDLKKDFAMHEDFRFMEQKEYADKRIEEAQQEIDSLKSEVVTLKLKDETEMKRIHAKLDVMTLSGTTQKLLSLGLVVVGIISLVIMVYFAAGLLGYLNEGRPVDLNGLLGMSAADANAVVYAVLAVVLALVAMASITTGYRIFTAKDTYEQVGLQFIKKKRMEEDR